MRISFFLILIPFFIFSCQETKIEIKEAKKAVTGTIVEKKIDTAVTIYLTFDDGPYITTPSVDSLLTSLNIKASFLLLAHKWEEQISMIIFIKL